MGRSKGVGMSLEDLLSEAAAWCRDASLGDGGQTPSFYLYWDDRKDGRWAASASSFYDGGGDGHSESPEEAVRLCLVALRESPERERAAVRTSAIWAVSRHWRCSFDEAERRLDATGESS